MVNDKNIFDLRERIAAACEGLVYTSETDAAVEPFAGAETDAVTAEILLAQIGAGTDASVAESSFEDFFDRSSAEKEWFGAAETARAKKFLELYKLLEENLNDRKVFRVGTTRTQIYAVGIDSDGRLTGVQTNAVET